MSTTHAFRLAKAVLEKNLVEDPETTCGLTIDVTCKDVTWGDVRMMGPLPVTSNIGIKDR